MHAAVKEILDTVANVAGSVLQVAGCCESRSVNYASTDKL